MGLYHSVAIAYGVEIPNDLDTEVIGDALGARPNPAERIDWIVVGDYDRTFLVTEHKRADENTVTPITPAYFTRYEIPAWDAALHDVAVRIGCLEHPQPGWLLIHNYR